MRYKSKTQLMVATAMMAALLAVVSPITIPVGPIPFSLAIFAVFLAGAMLPPLSAAVSVAVYVLIGVVGLPVFSGFRGGPQVLVGATGGYIAGYFLLALGISLGVRHFSHYAVRLVVGVAGLLACYLLGTLWFMYVMGTSFAGALAACVVPFIIPDIIKGALALGLAQALQRRMAKGGSAT